MEESPAYQSRPASEQTEISVENILESFRMFAPSVKPWIPAFQLMEHLREHTDCKFLLRTPIEPDIIA